MTDTRKLYDSLGKKYLTSMYLDNPWTKYVDRSEKKAVVEIWNLTSEKNRQEVILDLGMGPGRWSSFFISLGFKKVVGLDLSAKMVAAAKKYVNSSKFTAVKGDMVDLPLAKNSFDKIFCFRAFKYVSNPEKALSEIKRVLRPNGSVVLELSNKSLSNMILKYVALAVIRINPKLPLGSRFRYFARARFYSKADAFELINLSGLRVRSHRWFALFPSVPLTPGLTWLWIKLDSLLFKILPRQLFARSLIFLVSH